MSRSSNSPDVTMANALWGDDWLELRREWDLDYSVYHFNHGAYGAVPRKVRERQRELIRRIDGNPTGFFRRELMPLMEEARLRAAAFCGSHQENFAWVRNASEGMTAILSALPLQPGDEVLATNHIYGAVKLAIDKRCAATSAKPVEAVLPITADDTALLKAIAGKITERTRVLVVDEIASPSARLFPMPEIALLCRSNDIILVIDGAHAPGMYALNLEELGADFWVGNFHKWICAPHAAAGLWAAPRWHERLSPVSVSFRDKLPYPQNFGRLGTDDLTAVLCVPSALDFLEQCGAERIQRYNRELARLGAESIRKCLGTEPIQGRFAARHPVALPPGVIEDEADALNMQRQIAIELHAEISVSEALAEDQDAAMVISAFLYNHPDEYEKFGRTLKEWLLRKRLD